MLQELKDLKETVFGLCLSIEPDSKVNDLLCSARLAISVAVELFEEEKEAKDGQ